MKLFAVIALSAATLLGASAHAKDEHGFAVDHQQFIESGPYQEIGLDLLDIKNHRAINTYMLQSLVPSLSASSNPLSNYEAFLPHATQANFSRFERAVLAAYLDQPNDLQLAKFLAVYHQTQTLGGHLGSRAQQATRIKHAILAQYFLQRVSEMGGNHPWVEHTLDSNQATLDRFLNTGSPLDSNENHPAHLNFLDAFNYHEQNRYLVNDQLFEDLLANPNNALTNTYLTTVNQWIASEADFSDSTILYNYVWSSFFSVRAITIAEQRENAWKANPAVPRFRLAPGLGGWTIPPRRWLAKLLQDHGAIDALDNEHRAWRPKNRAFHSLTIGLAFFAEPEHFQEGFAALWDGYAHCNEVPTLRTCPDSPLVSFNILGFQLGTVDFVLKAGNVDLARQILNSQYYPPFQFGNFTLGQAAWQHRVQNLEAIAALYQNNDLSDDPTNFLTKRHQWGPDMTTCQMCHQAQGRSWTEAEKNAARPAAHESIASVNTWPAFSTTWYGSLR